VRTISCAAVGARNTAPTSRVLDDDGDGDGELAPGATVGAT
jgi:hypothetical protein